MSDFDKAAMLSLNCDRWLLPDPLSPRWMDSHQTAEMEAVQDKQKEVEGFCGPIISKLYQVILLTEVLSRFLTLRISINA